MNYALACLAALALLVADEDKIWLKDGKVVAGTIVDRKNAYVEITVDGRKQRVTREKIAKITDANDHVRWIDACETRTAHYTIQSNSEKASIDGLTRKVELFYAWFFANYNADLKLHAMKHLAISFIDHRDEYLTVAKVVQSGGVTPPGFYSQGSEMLFVCREPVGGSEDPDCVLFHEAGHQILHLCANLGGGDEHHWVNEAMACTFEGLKLDGDKAVMGLSDQRIRNLQLRIAHGEALHPLDVLDKLRKEQYHAPEYDQGYALALFFLTGNGGKWKKPFLAYFQDIALTRVRENTFERLFGRKIESFDAEWRDFVVALAVAPQQPGAGGPHR